MDELERENKLLKQYLAEAIEIANFTVSSHGFFSHQRLWELKIQITNSHVAMENSKLSSVIRSGQFKSNYGE